MGLYGKEVYNMNESTKILPRCYIVIETYVDYGHINILGVYKDYIDAEIHADCLNDRMQRKGIYNVSYSVIERPLHPYNW